MDTSMLLPAVALALASATATVDAAAAPHRIVLPTDVVPVHYDLAVVPDAAHMTFSGSVHIDLDVKQATRTIQLNAADLKFGKVSLSGVKETPAVRFDDRQETATLSFRSPVSAGHHVLNIDYSGLINQHAAGFFALDYDTPAGKKRALFTQFENSDARRFVPSWDEPGIKSTFTLSATVPADEMALSNMPIAKTEKVPGGLARVTFQQSPKMSSYLLFFGVGDFDRIHRDVNGVDVGVVVQKGDAAMAQYALDAAAQILPYYEEYFGVKFPLPKLDLIGGPGQSQFFGAMENWGAIFYFERDLIIDPKISTTEDKRDVYQVIAHEMAHQWFGDLVTMAWWDDLWLNEGFASWMEYKAPDHFHPEWKLWLDSVGAKEYAMRADARPSTHPIITPIYDVLQASQAFDGITYSKGQAVIRMLEDYVGADNFRAGVRAYMKAHAYGNTVTDDLWREMDRTSGQSITTVAHDFTLQPGIPLLRVNATAKGLHLTQDRFTADGSGKPALTWHVPVKVADADGKEIWRGVVSADRPVDVAVPAGSLAIVNAGQGGYYRSLYDSSTFAKLNQGFMRLRAADQLGLVNDSSALGLAGYESMGDFMELTRQTSANLDTDVVSSLIGKLDELARNYWGLPGEMAFKTYARKVTAPVLAKLGWDARPGEDSNATLLRSDVLSAMGDFDDPGVMAEARKRFETYMKDRNSLSADLRRVVLGIVAEHADAATWDEIHALAKAAGSNLEKRQLYVMLAQARDPALVQKALALSLTDEVPATTRPAMLSASSIDHPGMALDWYIAHQDEYNKVLEPASRTRYAPRLAFRGQDAAILQKLHAYAAAHIPPEARGDVAKADAAVNERIAIRSQRLPQVDAWLKTNGG
ncbi:MAG TPA: M1 family metallopeptidase [Gammaproteobacteria bacterium]|nr:M1 family metallopeptidase [Gammaproteobacteria bacterium]